MLTNLQKDHIEQNYFLYLTAFTSKYVLDVSERMQTQANSLLLNWFQKVQGWFDLFLRVVGLRSGADDGYVFTLGCHVVCVGDHAHIDI